MPRRQSWRSVLKTWLRRADFAHVVRLGWIFEVARVWVDWGKANGGAVEVPLYSARQVALLPVVRPEVDWAAIRRTAPGRRSLLAALTPAAPGQDVVSLDDVARIAGVRRASVVSWRRTLPGAPPLTAGTSTRPLFGRGAVAAWLLATANSPSRPPLWRAEMYIEDPEIHMYDCPGTLPGGGCEECKGWEGRTFADIRAELAGTPAAATVPASRRDSPALEAARAPHHGDHCERVVYEGGTCTCDGVDDYDREPANMIDLEDGVHSWWCHRSG